MAAKVSRRRFLAGAAGAVALTATPIVLSQCAADSEESKAPGSESMELSFDDPAYAALASVGGAVKVRVAGQSKPVIVIRKSETEAVALSSNCTHAGCEVELPDNGTLLCKCHGSTFDREGMVTRGPASAPLPRYTAVVQENKIVLTV